MNKKVEILAKKVRYDILDMLQHRGYGHLGGSLSLVELFAVLYGKQMKYDPKNHVLQYCMASNISGVIGSAVAAGVLISFLS